MNFNESIIIIKLVIASLGAALSNLLGGWDAYLKALVFLTILDYLSGVVKAILKNRKKHFQVSLIQP